MEVMFSLTVSASWMKEEESELMVVFFDRTGTVINSPMWKNDAEYLPTHRNCSPKRQEAGKCSLFDQRSQL